MSQSLDTRIHWLDIKPGTMLLNKKMFITRTAGTTNFWARYPVELVISVVSCTGILESVGVSVKPSDDVFVQITTINSNQKLRHHTYHVNQELHRADWIVSFV